MGVNEGSRDRELAWLRKVRDLSQALALEHDTARLLPRILDAAIEITGAERGFLVRVLGKDAAGRPRLEVVAARGFDRSSLLGKGGRVSQTVVERVLKRNGQGLVTSREEDADVIEASSVRSQMVVSILCTGLRLRGRVFGVLYLDHRFDEEAFAESDLPILDVFASQAALALETAELLADRAPQPNPPAGDRAPRPLDRLPERVARYGRLVGDSDPLRALCEEIERTSRYEGSVLVLGEVGTERLDVAREIHARSSRRDEPFVLLDARADPPDVVAERLAGPRGRVGDGALARAGRGSLVILDAEALSPLAQARLVERLEHGVVADCARASLVRAECRVFAISSANLRERAAQGSFREDLYYHLDVMRLVVPPLRQRPEDLPHLLAHLDLELGEPRLRYSPKALAVLCAYAWPGNLQELRNEVRRLKAAGVPRVGANALSEEIRTGRGVAGVAGDFAGKTLGEVEGEMLRAALERCRGNKAAAARQLGVPRSTLYHLIERHGLGRG
ncbi:MAG: sigma-54-dependent Fis family transcriptional regulator [Planctomycetota bacterium]|nr:MAG: sigma-54-dependent Fis family transcriptional regulator [Planctomycetota bacterium]